MEIGNLLFGNSRGAYPVQRNIWQEKFIKFLKDIGLDSYGYVSNNHSEYLKTHTTEDGGFENDVFLIRPYYWGDDADIASMPNFVFKKTGYSLQWYKYPLRDSYANQEISFEEFSEMLRICFDSIK